MKILRQITYPKITYLSALFENSTENNNNGAAVGQKGSITNNDRGSTPAKVPCYKNLAKTISDVEVDLEILNQVDQEHQIP